MGIEWHIDDEHEWFDMDCMDFIDVAGIVKTSAYIEVDKLVRHAKKAGVEFDGEDAKREYILKTVEGYITKLFNKCTSVAIKRGIDPLQCEFNIRFDVERWDIAVRARMVCPARRCVGEGND